jgi:hypothetical protein
MNPWLMLSPVSEAPLLTEVSRPWDVVRIYGLITSTLKRATIAGAKWR